MNITISTAPCCWGVHDANDSNQPPWPRILQVVSQHMV
jgi:hypothetical protein